MNGETVAAEKSSNFLMSNYALDKFAIGVTLM